MHFCKLYIVFILLTFRGTSGTDPLLRTARSDDATFASLESIIQQQATAIQALQGQLIAAHNRLEEAESRIGALESSDHGQNTQIATLSDKQAKSGQFFLFVFFLSYLEDAQYKNSGFIVRLIS